MKYFAKLMLAFLLIHPIMASADVMVRVTSASSGNTTELRIDPLRGRISDATPILSKIEETDVFTANEDILLYRGQRLNGGFAYFANHSSRFIRAHEVLAQISSAGVDLAVIRVFSAYINSGLLGLIDPKSGTIDDDTYVVAVRDGKVIWRYKITSRKITLEPGFKIDEQAIFSSPQT